MKESVRVLLTEEEVDRKIDELGAQITRDYAVSTSPRIILPAWSWKIGLR